ncbi:MAG: choice-of-anchor D domain-containing protein, partial [Candidatus Dormibacteraceae bacterium]
MGAHLSQKLTLTNTGTAGVDITQASVSGQGFSISGLSLPLTLTPGQSVSFNANFAPAAAGGATGALSIASNASSSPSAVSLSGMGVTLQVAVNPTSLNFGSVKVGASSAQTVTLKNTGLSSLTISQASISGAEFAMNGLSLPTTLPPGQSANFGATFAPTAAGSAAGSIAVVSDAADSPASVPLSGTGVAVQLAASPSTVNFGNVAVGGNGTQTITLINPGTSSVTITQASVAGAGFTLGGLSLPTTLSGEQSLNFNATFSPTAAGSATGTISIISNASSSPLLVPLSGTGGTFQLTVNPASVNFGNVKVGASGSQTVRLNNTGTSRVTISQATVSGAGFTIDRPSLPLTLTAGQSVSFNVKFAPTVTGNAAGGVSVLSNASNSPTSIPLSGAG